MSDKVKKSSKKSTLDECFNLINEIRNLTFPSSKKRARINKSKNITTLFYSNGVFQLCLQSRCKDIGNCWDLKTLSLREPLKLANCETWRKPITQQQLLPKQTCMLRFSTNEYNLILLALQLLKQNYKEPAKIERLIDKVTFCNQLLGTYVK